MHTEISTLDSVSSKNLLLFSFPIFLSLFLSGLYGAIDLWMVGRFALPEDVSAVSIGGNFMNIVLSLFSGLTIGCTVELATKLASGDKENAGFVAGTSVRLFAILGLVFSILLFFLSPLIAKLMHTPEESLSRTIIYLRVSSLGCIPLSLFVLLSGIFKALGNSKIPFIFVGVTSVLNVLLNYIFVRFFHIGTLGVALATLISECISVVLSYIYIHKKHFPFKFAKEQFEAHKGYTRMLLKMGLPIAFEEIVTEGSFVVVLSFANTMGLYISAGVGIAGKILAFVMFIPLTFMQTVSVFSAFSLGSNNFPTDIFPFAGGTGAGVSVQPVGFLVVTENQVKVLPAQTTGAMERMVELLPQLLEELNAKDEKEKKKNKIFGKTDSDLFDGELQ